LLHLRLYEFRGGENHAAQTSSLAVDVLRRGIDDAIGTEFERLLKERRREHVVDGKGCASRMGDLANFADWVVGASIDIARLQTDNRGAADGRQSIGAHTPLLIYWHAN